MFLLPYIAKADGSEKQPCRHRAKGEYAGELLRVIADVTSQLPALAIEIKSGN
jgi:hypothetical protein